MVAAESTWLQLYLLERACDRRPTEQRGLTSDYLIELRPNRRQFLLHGDAQRAGPRVLLTLRPQTRAFEVLP